jgi:hypothetical protein
MERFFMGAHKLLRREPEKAARCRSFENGKAPDAL